MTTTRRCAHADRERNRRDNEARAARNAQLRAHGLPTPWEKAKAARKARRDQLRAEGLLPPIGMTRAQWESDQQRKVAV